MSVLSSVGSVVHKVIDGVHHLFVHGEQAVESVKVYIDGRPGLKKDIDTLLGPIKDAAEKSIHDEYGKLLAAGSPAEALAELKKAIPAIQQTIKESFAGQASHLGHLDVLINLAINAILAALGPPQSATS